MTWHVRKINVSCGYAAGVTGHLFLFVREVEVDRVAIMGNDGVGVTRVLIVDVDVGDTIDLALDPTSLLRNRGDSCDSSATWLKIASPRTSPSFSGAPIPMTTGSSTSPTVSTS